MEENVCELCHSSMKDYLNINGEYEHTTQSYYNPFKIQKLWVCGTQIHICSNCYNFINWYNSVIVTNLPSKYDNYSFKEIQEAYLKIIKRHCFWYGVNTKALIKFTDLAWDIYEVSSKTKDICAVYQEAVKQMLNMTIKETNSRYIRGTLNVDISVELKEDKVAQALAKITETPMNTSRQLFEVTIDNERMVYPNILSFIVDTEEERIIL